jgi:Skp family chaperone for outer membrane proteins
MRLPATVAAAALALGLLGAGAVSASLAQDPAPAPAGTGPAAYLNINKAFLAYPRARKLMEDLSAQADRLKADLDAKGQELRKREADLEVTMEPGTPEYHRARRALRVQAAEIDLDRKEGLEEILRRQSRGMAGVYRDVRAEAERIAKARGFSALFAIDPDPILVEERGQVIGVNELKLQMALRTSLWCRPELDITDEVIAALPAMPEAGPGPAKDGK